MTNFDFLKQDENNLKKDEIKRITDGAIDNIATYLAPAASSLLSAAVVGALAGPEGVILG